MGKCYEHCIFFFCIHLGDEKLETWTSSNETKARSLEPGKIKADNVIICDYDICE